MPLLSLLALGACGEAIKDDHFANDVQTEREPAVTTTAAAQVRIGELGPNFDACNALGTTRHVPTGQSLPVQAAPFASASQAGAIPAGGRFFICSRSIDQKWFGIVYDQDGPLGARCGVSSPIPARRAYEGPCSSGWVSSAFVKLIAGTDEAPALPPASAPAQNQPGSGT